jgi:translation initiation factor 3 subunit F
LLTSGSSIVRWCACLVDAILKGASDENDTKLDAPATIVSDLEALANSLNQLHTMLGQVSTYVANVVDGKIQGDSEVGRAIVAALTSVPLLEAASFEKMFNNQVQDLLMIVYLANLTRTQLALADKINGLLQ